MLRQQTRVYTHVGNFTSSFTLRQLLRTRKSQTLTIITRTKKCIICIATTTAVFVQNYCLSGPRFNLPAIVLSDVFPHPRKKHEKNNFRIIWQMGEKKTFFFLVPASFFIFANPMKSMPRRIMIWKVIKWQMVQETVRNDNIRVSFIYSIDLEMSMSLTNLHCIVTRLEVT